jgi:protein TonB
LAIIPPRIRERPPIQLPATLSQAGLSGEVLLLVEVREDGQVGKVSLERSSGNKALDELARDNVLRWKFDPARQPHGGKSVRVLTAVWVRFVKE